MRTFSSGQGRDSRPIVARHRGAPVAPGLYIRKRYHAPVTRERVALSIIGGLSLAIVGLVGVLLLGHQPGRAWGAEVAALPALNAALNATCAVLLGVGWLAIRRRRVALHRACMLAACLVSALFLVSYVIYHALAGSRPFGGQGWIRAVYFPILFSHVALARRTLPVWLYVSVTGVVVYLLLYHLG